MPWRDSLPRQARRQSLTSPGGHRAEPHPLAGRRRRHHPPGDRRHAGTGDPGRPLLRRAVITEAGNHEKVTSLMYITAFDPDKGESVSTLIADPPPGAPVPPILPPNDGFLFLDRDKFAGSFAGDLPRAQAEFMADSQVPWAWTRSTARCPSRPAHQVGLIPGGRRRPDDPAAGPVRDGRADRSPYGRGAGKQPFRLRLAARRRRRPDQAGRARLSAT